MCAYIFRITYRFDLEGLLMISLSLEGLLMMPDYKYDACVNKKMVVHMDKNCVGSRAIQMHEYGNTKKMAPVKTIVVRRL